MSSRLLLLRHGRTAWNAERRFQGQLDPPLDEVGVDQAAVVGPLVAALQPEVILCSDLRRATATAEPLSRLAGVQPSYDERFREIGLGTWQGLTMDEAAVQFPAEFQSWRQGLDVRRGGGETYVEVAARAIEAITTGQASAGGLTVVVTHGGTSRAIVGKLLGLEPGSWSVLGPLGNCRWSLLMEQDGRGWRLGEHNSGCPEVRL